MKLGTAIQPRLEFTQGPHGPRWINTTGDFVDPQTTILVPKDYAKMGHDAGGRELLLVQNRDHKQAVIPRDAFQEVDKAFYLPTYKDSANTGALRGGMRGLVTMAPLGVTQGLAGGVAGFTGGLVGNAIPTESRSLKLLAGTATGVVTMAAVQALAGGPTSLGVALMLGGLTGLTGTVGGTGKAQVRDCLSGGTLAGIALGIAAHNPFLSVTAGAASALGGHAKNPFVRVATSTGIGAALGAAEALATHNSVAIASAITAAAAGLGSLVGPALMQGSRNLSKSGSDGFKNQIGGWVSRQNNPTLIATGAVPGALSGAMMGSCLGALEPSLMVPGIAVGAALGGAAGAYRVHKMLEK